MLVGDLLRNETKAQQRKLLLQIFLVDLVLLESSMGLILSLLINGRIDIAETADFGDGRECIKKRKTPDPNQ